MSRFIKFSHLLLNTNDIHKIVITSNKYNIYICGKQIEGNGYLFCASGATSVSSYTEEMEVCKTKNEDDYKILSKWINTFEPLDPLKDD